MSSLSPNIPTRSEQQAWDWSLVLASQGIEAIVDFDQQAGSWYLIVNGPDYARALQTLRQYLLENKSRRWQQPLPLTGMLMDWRSAFAMLFLIFLHFWQAHAERSLVTVGIMNSRAVLAGEWWRPFTAVTLHADAAHLAANVTTGILLLGLAMGAFGAGVGLLIPFLAGVAGNLAGMLIYEPDRQVLGASGMVMGALGLLAAPSFTLLRHGLTTRLLVARGLFSAFLLLILLGFSPKENVDVLGHVAGFGAGLLLGSIAASLPPTVLPRLWIQRMALAITLFCVLFSWWVAFRGGHV